MTNQLEAAIEKLAELPEEEQNAIAKWILEEISSEKKWDELFAESQEQLESLAEEAMEEYNRGETKKLDIEKL